MAARVYIFLVLSICASFCIAENWVINTIDSKIGGKPSFAVDSNNSLLIVHATGKDADLALQRSSNYYESNVIPNTSYCEICSLKVTSNDEIALVFLDTSTKKIWYAIKGNWFDWTFTEVSFSDCLGIDMALSENDIPHIVYIQNINGQNRVIHSWFDIQSSSWMHETMFGFNAANIFHPPDIDISASGKIIISCSDSDNQMRAAVFLNGFWDYLPAIQNFSPPNACFTPDEIPATAYIRDGTMYYSVYIDGIGWHETPICLAEATDPPREISLAHSSTGIPGIAFVTREGLMYASKVSALWTVTKIDYGFLQDLVFNLNDKPLIAYYRGGGCLNEAVLKVAGIDIDYFHLADLDKNKIINFADFAILAEHWMAILPEPQRSIGDFTENGIIDADDLKWLGCNWLENQF